MTFRNEFTIYNNTPYLITMNFIQYVKSSNKVAIYPFTSADILFENGIFYYDGQMMSIQKYSTMAISSCFTPMPSIKRIS